MFTSIGTIRYSPKSAGKDTSTKWWCVIDCDRELGKYYRHLHLRAGYGQLARPAWAEHITVIRDEEPSDPYKPIWEKYEGKEIAFKIVLPGDGDEIYEWFPVECEFALDLREELGLPRQPFFPLHLTYGNRK